MARLVNTSPQKSNLEFDYLHKKNATFTMKGKFPLEIISQFYKKINERQNSRTSRQRSINKWQQRSQLSVGWEVSKAKPNHKSKEVHHEFKDRMTLTVTKVLFIKTMILL